MYDISGNPTYVGGYDPNLLSSEKQSVDNEVFTYSKLMALSPTAKTIRFNGIASIAKLCVET